VLEHWERKLNWGYSNGNRGRWKGGQSRLPY
jgi:hypothetical protein